MPEPVRFGARRRVGWVLGALFYAAIGILIAPDPRNLSFGAFWADPWVWLLPGLAFVAAGVDLWRYLARRQDLVIDGQELYCRGFSNEPVPWPDIERVEMKASGGSDCLIVTLRPIARLPRGIIPVVSRWLQRLTGGGHIAIHPELLDTNLDEIAREIERFHPIPIRWSH